MNLVLFVAAPLILSIFGPAYAAQATTLLRLFGLGIFPITINSMFVPITRVERRFLSGASLMALSMVIEFVFVVLGARAGGLDGAGVGWLVGYCAQRPAVRAEDGPRGGPRGGAAHRSDLLGPVPAAVVPRSEAAPAAALQPVVRTAIGRTGSSARMPGWPPALPLLQHDDWTIGLVDRPIQSFLGTVEDVRVTWLPRRPGTMPRPVRPRPDGNVHVFFEEFDQRRGRGAIAHLRVAADGTASVPETVIDPAAMPPIRSCSRPTARSG